MSQHSRFNKVPAGRADLLRAFADGGTDALEHSAKVLGYSRRQTNDLEQETSKPNFNQTIFDKHDLPREPSEQKDATTPVKQAAISRYFRITQQQQLSEESIQQQRSQFQQAIALTETDLNADPTQAKLPLPALIPWKRLWPVLRNNLGRQRNSRKVLVKPLVNALSRGVLIKRIPYRQKHIWSSHCQLILDLSAASLLFQQDMAELCAQLMQLRGTSGLEVLVIRDPLTDLRLLQNAIQMPSPTKTVMIVSDLGHYDSNAGKSLAWQRFVQRLQRNNASLFVLSPTPTSVSPLNLSYKALSWDRSANSANRRAVPSDSQHEHQLTADDLLTLLAPAIRVEPSLLRAMRYQLPISQAHVGLEAAVWLHDDVERCQNGFRFINDKKHRYLERFKLLPTALKRQACETIIRYHQHLPPDVLAEELLNARYLGGVAEEYSEKAIGRSWQIAKTLAQDSAAPAGVSPWLLRLSQRLANAMWQQNPALETAWYLHYQSAKQSGIEIKRPPGLSLARASAYLHEPQLRVRYKLYQLGADLVVSNILSQVDSHFNQASLLGYINAMHPYLDCRLDDAQGNSVNQTIQLDSQQTVVQLEQQATITLITDQETLVLQDQQQKPIWASNIGRDQYGLYAEFTYQSTTQRLRWINPGSFFMGSPADEIDRETNETQHQVTLTQGYWLADTACTQALWEAVMGDNPSDFKASKQNPVDSVSWNDIDQFIYKINHQLPGLDLRLPTEAEWEYACRTDTQTPFSFGENITPDQVNYNGNHPYAQGETGEYRNKTLEVKALPANSWGLYQMHGNVWEWCADWFDHYATEPVTDPQGPATGDNRLLRGGSWFDDGRDVRSAYRINHTPSYRYLSSGFRLARGPQARQARE